MEASKKLTVDKGVSIAYRLWCSEEQPRPLLVLLHGLASNMTRWTEFLEHTTLRDSWDILRVDLRGHGGSLCRCPLNMEVWCDDLARVLDVENRSQAVLIGHSLGAQVAVYFANRYSTRVNGLVLIDPILGRTFKGQLRLASRFAPVIRLMVMILRTLNRVGLHRRHIPMRDLRALDQKVRETLLAEGQHEEMVREYSSTWLDLKYFPTANYLEETVEMMRPLPPLSSITAPVLVVLARGVTFYDPRITQQMIAQFKNAQTIYIDAYHWPLTEKPDEVRGAIESWCAELEEHCDRPICTGS